MFLVQWVSINNGKLLPSCQLFNQAEMSKALNFTNELRARVKAGESLAFISLTSENIDCVGEMGVTAIGEDHILPDGTQYTWRKRRP